MSAGVPAMTVAGRIRWSRTARRHAVTGRTRAGVPVRARVAASAIRTARLGIGGEYEELRVGVFRIQPPERRLDELRNSGRVVRQYVQYVLIAGDSRSLPLFQVLVHQTPDFQWRGNVPAW